MAEEPKPEIASMKLIPRISEENKVPQFSNCVIVRHGTYTEFVLEFCFLDPIDMGEAIKEEKEEVSVTLVSRIALSPEVLQNAIKAMSNNLEKFLKAKPKLEEFLETEQKEERE